jgi:hypothetical protein
MANIEVGFGTARPLFRLYPYSHTKKCTKGKGKFLRGEFLKIFIIRSVLKNNLNLRRLKYLLRHPVAVWRGFFLASHHLPLAVFFGAQNTVLKRPG